MNHLRSVRSLAQVSVALEEAGVRHAVVKGPVLATRWHRDPAARPYQDLDLLVDHGSLPTAVEALVAAGFGHRNRNWHGFRRLGVGEVPLDDGTTVLDLHWHLVGLAEHRRGLALPTAELLDRAVEVELGQRRVLTLDDADTLVHLCVHHAFAGAHRLLQLKDVHLVASAVPADLALERIRRAGAERLAGVVIDRAERTFGPLGAASLAPRVCSDTAWLRFNRAIDGTWATATPRRWSPMPGALVGAGRRTRRATMRALTAQVAHSVRPRLGMANVVSPGGPLDWEHDDGGEAARCAYFDEVAAGCYGR